MLENTLADSGPSTKEDVLPVVRDSPDVGRSAWPSHPPCGRATSQAATATAMETDTAGQTVTGAVLRPLCGGSDGDRKSHPGQARLARAGVPTAEFAQPLLDDVCT